MWLYLDNWIFRRVSKPMKILLIEDDKQMSRHIARALSTNGHEVEECDNGPEGAKRALAGSHAALIVDRMLPGLDGLSLVKNLRANGSLTPVLLLTTMDGIDDRVEGLEGGADDYLTKPFATAELLARVHAITRRSDARPNQERPALLKVAGLEMDLILRKVTRDGKPVELQAQEFKLLEYMVRNAERVVTRAMLLEHVWDLHFDPRTKIVETHMSRLRAKLDRDGSGEIIHTIRGSGYVLRAS
jgi:two-component system OmpR family response regulator